MPIVLHAFQVFHSLYALLKPDLFPWSHKYYLVFILMDVFMFARILKVVLPINAAKQLFRDISGIGQVLSG